MSTKAGSSEHEPVRIVESPVTVELVQVRQNSKVEELLKVLGVLSQGKTKQ